MTRFDEQCTQTYIIYYSFILHCLQNRMGLYELLMMMDTGGTRACLHLQVVYPLSIPQCYRPQQHCNAVVGYHVLFNYSHVYVRDNRNKNKKNPDMIYSGKLYGSIVQSVTKYMQLEKQGNKTMHMLKKHGWPSSYYNSSNVCRFVPLLLRGPLTDLHQTWWVYVGGPWNCP